MQASDILINGKFSKAQLELLKLFATEPSQEELETLRQFFVQYLAEKALNSVEEAIAEKGYTQEEINAWSKEHNRTVYQSYRKYLANKNAA